MSSKPPHSRLCGLFSSPSCLCCSPLSPHPLLPSAIKHQFNSRNRLLLLSSLSFTRIIIMSTTTALADPSAIIRPARTPRAPPHTGRYRLSGLANLPNRLVKPGELIERELEQRPALYGKATAGEGECGEFRSLLNDIR